MQGVRGMSVIMVMAEHYLFAFFSLVMLDSTLLQSSSTIISKSLYTPANLLYNGSAAVCIFFVLSGYVLSYKFFRTEKRFAFTDLVVNCVKRYFRLMIPVAVIVMLIWTMGLLDLFFFNQMIGITQSINPDYYSQDLGLTAAIELAVVGVLFDGSYAFNPPLWTMKIELFGSIIVYSIMFIANNKSRAIRYLLYIIGIVVFFDSYYFSFILGVLLSDYSADEQGSGLTRLNSYSISCIFAMSLVLMGYTIKGYSSGYYQVFMGDLFGIQEYKLQIIGSALFIFCIMSSDRLKGLFKIKLLLMLGKISFGIYLIHYLVLSSVMSFAFIYLLQSLSFESSFLIAFMFIGFPMTIASSILFESTVNTRLLKLLDKSELIIRVLFKKKKGFGKKGFV